MRERERERELRERISQFLLSQSLEEPPPMPLWFLRSWILCGIEILYGDSTNNLDSLLVLISNRAPSFIILFILYYSKLYDKENLFRLRGA